MDQAVICPRSCFCSCSLFCRILAALLALAGSLAPAAHAQSLPDPTRPALGSGPGAAAPAPPQLQVVLIGSGSAGRRVAVISGQTLRIGDKFGGAVLASISSNEVVLREGNTVRVLKLFPVPEQKNSASDGNSKQ